MAASPNKRIWVVVRDDRVAFQVNLSDDSTIDDLKRAIKAELSNKFRDVDAPAIIVRNRDDVELEGNLMVKDLSPSTGTDEDGWSLGLTKAFPYMIKVRVELGLFYSCSYSSCIFHILAGHVHVVAVRRSYPLPLCSVIIRILLRDLLFWLIMTTYINAVFMLWICSW